MMKILFVCTGNTCRSPIAEGLAKQLLPDDFEILSSGIDAYAGQAVSEQAVQVLQEKNIDIGMNKAVKLDEQLLTRADYVLVMTRKHELHLRHTYPQFQSKIKRLGDFVGYDRDITDPWGGSLEDYRHCVQELEEMIWNLAERLKYHDQN